jgi:hypothetical protein
VHIPLVNINNFLLDQFGPFNYRNSNTVLLEKLLERSRNVDEKMVFAHFGKDKFEIVVTQNQKLLLFNSFDYMTKEDFLYYLLFTAEQLALNPETLRLQLLGSVAEGDDYFKIAYKYVRNVSMLDVSDMQRHNDFSVADNLKHFILLGS